MSFPLVKRPILMQFMSAKTQGAPFISFPLYMKEVEYTRALFFEALAQ